jgi:hypothetical protein
MSEILELRQIPTIDIPFPRHRHAPDPLVSSFSDCVIRLSEPLSRRWAARFARIVRRRIVDYQVEESRVRALLLLKAEPR